MIPQEDWNKYIDTGEISIEIIKEIAERIKSGANLDLKDLQVYQTHAELIEHYLRG